VEVDTDDGITGVGHASRLSDVIATVVERAFSKPIGGVDPTRRETLWDRMYRATIPFGRKGAAVEAIAAVDLAL
jgi:L-alanine-DL-glutamate epimerase-like enolase superfamily enzyme